MTSIFRCGHERTPENQVSTGSGRVDCRQCRIEAKRRWRERKRAIAEGAVKIKTGPAPAAPEPPKEKPEARGSRRLLEAYALYYERHVISKAA